MLKRIGTILLLIVIFISDPTSGKESHYTELVDPFIGTGGHGHTYPGACLPFGMVQLSPDTRLTGWDGCSAYHYSDSVVFGFSHTHLSGTGCSDYGDILFMPTTGEFHLERGSAANPESGYCSRFQHEYEKASPGYYSVFLDDYAIKVELTVTERAGFHKYTYPKSDKANIIIDLEHRDEVKMAYIHIVNDSEIVGFRRSKAWANDQHVYFVARFSKPFHAAGIAVKDKIKPGIKKARGKSIKSYVSFRTKESETILVKVGISAVSIKGAIKNLEAEIPDWDFNAIEAAANERWNTALGKIRVEGGTKVQQAIFYTSLYHAMLQPNLFIDVDGKYRGTDLKVHVADGADHYTVFSLWDTFRAMHPLFTIIEPQRTADFIETFIRQYEQGGHLPVWELAANETWCMIGYHAVPVIVDAYIKGIRDYDAEKALTAMKHSAELDHYGLRHYKQYGYIPADKEGESVSKTLEYAYDDWCIAQMAKALGKKEEYKKFIQRAQYYKNVFDPTTGFMRAKSHAIWHTPFDPLEVNANYTEANSWQYSFYVPHDVSGLIDLMGGKTKFLQKLDELFATTSITTGRRQADITGMIGQYAHGNEPSHHMAYLYNFANEPWKAQRRVREIMDRLYTSAPDGLCGNEDCGQMSSWYIFSSLGFYPVTPGQGIYIIGTPIFNKATVDLQGGKQFIIEAKHVSNENIYIQSATLNGEPFRKSYLKHNDIMNSGVLVFEMGPAPNKAWGSNDDDIPTTSIDDHQILPVPYVASRTGVFTDSTEIILATISDGVEIRYNLNGSNPTFDSRCYTGPIKIDTSTVIQAFACKEDLTRSFTISSEFNKIPVGRTIKLKTSYSSQYTGGGDMALIDQARGSDNFRTGAWQGYQGVDVDATVCLGNAKNISRISTGFLQDQRSWIFMPAQVEYAISVDGETFDVIATIANDIPHDLEGSVIKNFSLEKIDRKATCIRVRAKNIGVCPPWHGGAGEKAWIFVDEIIIE